jgi:hypothetical protein
MPNSAAHVAQYRHNLDVLAAPVFSLDNPENLDWAATIIFYCAVHLVEKVLADSQNPFHCENHNERRRAFTRERRLRQIAAQYHALYNQSIRARYQCARFTRQDIEDALNLLLAPIERAALAS